MQFNRTNRPKAKYPHNSVTEKWFKGFFNEVRERYDKALAEPSDEMDKLDNLTKLVEEILV